MFKYYKTLNPHRNKYRTTNNIKPKDSKDPKQTALTSTSVNDEKDYGLMILPEDKKQPLLF